MRLVAGGGDVYDRRSAARPSGRSSRDGCGVEVTVYSFVGVIGITLVLFLVVAITARLILGR